MTETPTEAFCDVIEALLAERPEAWANDSRSAKHQASGVEIKFYYSFEVCVDGAELKLAMRQRRRLRAALQKHLAVKAVKRLREHA